MKKLFTKAELIKRRGCYEKSQIETLWNGGRGETVTIVEILKSEISVKDKMWFLRNKTELTLDQKKAFAVIAAWVVLPIFEERRPDDKRPREALEAIEKFKKGEITKEQLRTAADAAYAAAAAYAYAYAAADAAYAYAAADADAAYAYAAYAAADADAYAAYAAADYAGNKTTYSQRLQIAAIEFVNSIE